MIRSELNKKIGVLVHAVLRLNEDYYRQIVYNIDQKSGGFVRNCDDEHANLVLLHLQGLISKQSSPREEKKQSDQERFIARLMDHLSWKWSDTSSFMKKITGKHHTRNCTTGELSKVIRGMISIIDQDIDKGKIVMSERELKEYRYKTNFHRRNSQPAAEVETFSIERSKQ